MVSLQDYPVPDSGIQHSEPNVTATVGTNQIDSGTLYITQSSVVWLNTHGQGLELQYRQICLHAVSRDLTAFPHEHLLCHYEGKLPGLDSVDDDNEDTEDNDSCCEITEIRFTPQNKDSLEAMFQALASCQTLHPDSDCQLSEEEDYEDADEAIMAGGDAVYNSEEGLANLTEEGGATMERLNQMLARQGGAGDEGDITQRTGNIQISNGHHANGDAPMDADQFLDADDENGQ